MIDRIKIKNSKALLVFFTISLLLVVLDYVSKIIILETFSEAELTSIPINSYLNLVLVMNHGISFGFFSNMSMIIPPLFWNIMAIMALIIITIVVSSGNEGIYLKTLILSLIWGGAVGNGIDRIMHGAVTDFIDVHWDIYHFHVFNLADSFITIGVLAWLFPWGWFKKK